MHTNQIIIKNKVGLLNLAEELGNVSKACKIMGFSRDTFYRYQAALNEGCVDALLDKSRHAPNLKNSVAPEIETKALELALELPAYGQVRISNELRKSGIALSPGGVRSIWLRNDLETFKKRLRRLEQHIAETGAVLTEAQLTALETKKEQGVAHGEIESEHPG